MLESMNQKNFFPSLAVTKVQLKDAPKKIKKCFAKQIKKIKQNTKLSHLNLRRNNKNKIDDLKNTETQLQGVLKDSNRDQVGFENNEYEVKISKQPEWQQLTKALTTPGEVEKSLYSSLKKNGVREGDIDLIKKSINKMKETNSSDDIVVKIYDFLELFSNQGSLTNKFIIDYLDKPMEIDRSTQDTNLNSLSSQPEKTKETSDSIDVSDRLYNELIKNVFEISREKNITDELFSCFGQKLSNWKKNEQPEVFKIKVNELFNIASEIVSKKALDEIKLKLKDDIEIKNETVKPISIFDDTIPEPKPKTSMEKWLNTIEWKLFFFLEKIEKAYSGVKKEMKKIFSF